MKYEVKKIDIWSTAKFTGIFYGLISLVPVVFAMVIYFFEEFSRHGLDSEILIFFVIPLIVFIAGLIAGALFALVYNAIAAHVGGFKMEIEYHEDKN